MPDVHLLARGPGRLREVPVVGVRLPAGGRGGARRARPGLRLARGRGAARLGRRGRRAGCGGARPVPHRRGDRRPLAARRDRAPRVGRCSRRRSPWRRSWDGTGARCGGRGGRSHEQGRRGRGRARGAGGGGPARARRARGHRAGAGGAGRREARLVQPRRLLLRHRAVAAHRPVGVRGAVRRDRGAAGRGAGRAGRRPGLPLPLRRRDRPGRARPAAARRSRRPWTPRSGRARARSGRPSSSGPDGCGRPPAARSSPPRWTAPGGCCGSRARSATWRRSRPGAACASSAGATSRTRGCGCCSTATPPTPARTRAAPRRPWPRVPYVEQTYGAWYVQGGLRALVDAVAAARRGRSGPTVRTGADVAQVIVKDAPGPVGWRTSGVRLRDGSTVEADVVVSNADAAHTYHELLSGPPGELGRRRLRRADPSLSGFVLLLALRGRTPGLQHHTVLFPEDYDDEFDSVFATGRHRGRARPAPDPTVYVSAPDDPALRPDDDSEAVVRAGQRPSAPAGRAGPRRRLARRRAGRELRRPGAGGDGRARARRARPGAVAGGAHPGRPGARDAQRRRLHLRQLEQRRPVGVPAPGQREQRRGPVPRRGLRAPRAAASRWWG